MKLFIIRAVVRSDAFYPTTVRRYGVLRMWGTTGAHSSSRHHLVQCPEHMVRCGNHLVHHYSTKDNQEGHCPGSDVVNHCLRFLERQVLVGQSASPPFVQRASCARNAERLKLQIDQ